ncbi:hypothetical protein HaLaN_07469 [Haematococcus lacustris]|uniref:Uncharacterized protein n=1 Tax=Haematococcus lacustris TaxID=44745 RepID=A0A699YQL7_HAELA|nr:hypothetical protein HaLaN_07469 [Haematococcus lacustris]
MPPLSPRQREGRLPRVMWPSWLRIVGHDGARLQPGSWDGAAFAAYERPNICALRERCQNVEDLSD